MIGRACSTTWAGHPAWRAGAADLFVADAALPSSQIKPVACNPAACLGDEPRIWIVGSGRLIDPYLAVAANQAAVLRPRYRLASPGISSA